MNRILLVALSVAVASCATPETQVDRTAPVPLAASTVAEPAATAAEPAAVAGPTEGEQSEPPASDGIHDDGIGEEAVGGIEEVEAPQPLETPAEMIPRPVVESPVVCTWEVPTGSRLRVKVCRDRAYMERKEEQDQDIFSDMKTRTAIGASQL